MDDVDEHLARLLFCPPMAPERDATALAPLIRRMSTERGARGTPRWRRPMVHLLASLQAAQLGMFDEADALLWEAYACCFERGAADPAAYDVLCELLARTDAMATPLPTPIADARRFLESKSKSSVATGAPRPIDI